ncbi:hypothetical protein IQ238_14195 [Pleurocapsales cyanobacterium LEGE 06147]|nr:hypothetical protein [Pleurocapsales cyanobacterium LEGE 06147]
MHPTDFFLWSESETTTNCHNLIMAKSARSQLLGVGGQQNRSSSCPRPQASSCLSLMLIAVASIGNDSSRE